MFSDKKCTESASTIWQKNNGVNYEQNYSAFHTSWTGDTIGSKEYVPFYSYRISRGLLGNEVLDFSDKGSEAESWCDIYSFTADSNAPADCYATAAFSCFSLRKAPDRKTPPLERKSETAKWVGKHLLLLDNLIDKYTGFWKCETRYNSISQGRLPQK